MNLFTALRYIFLVCTFAQPLFCTNATIDDHAYLQSLIDQLNLDPTKVSAYCAEARKHTPWGKSLKDLAAHLDMEEEMALWAIKHEFNIPYVLFKNILSSLKNAQRLFQKSLLCEKKSVVLHNLAAVDKEYYEHVIAALKIFGIEQHCIDITCHDDDISINGTQTLMATGRCSKLNIASNCPALIPSECKISCSYLKTLKNYWNLQLSFLSPLKFANYCNSTLSSCSSLTRSILTDFNLLFHKTLTPLHECMHVWDAHPIQDLLLVVLFANNLNIDEEAIKNSQSIQKWRRVLEKRASLLPLIMFKKSFALRVYIYDTLLRVMAVHPDPTTIKWNKVEEGTTHPSEAELLPWLLKIHDIMKLNYV